MLAVGAVVHFTPDASRKWECAPALCLIEADETNLAKLRVFNREDGRSSVVDDVVFDEEQREQGTWHYVHMRNDTRWFEPRDVPPPPPEDEPPAEGPPAEQPPADEPPAEEPPTEEEPPSEPPTEPEPPAEPTEPEPAPAEPGAGDQPTDQSVTPESTGDGEQQGG